MLICLLSPSIEYILCFVTFKGQPKEALEAVMPGSISSISVGSWNIVVQEEDRNELSDLSAASANAPMLNGNGLKENAGESAALLGTYLCSIFF